MPKIKGYYNVDLEVFLGPMTATNDGTGVMSTPRYIEGVCFGEYDSDTKEFVPETNPMRIPKGSIMTVDEDETAFQNGQHKETVTGIIEDKGADIARKQIHLVNPQGVPLHKKPNINLDKLF